MSVDLMLRALRKCEQASVKWGDHWYSDNRVYAERCARLADKLHAAILRKFEKAEKQIEIEHPAYVGMCMTVKTNQVKA